jgi:hypothetical protein
MNSKYRDDEKKVEDLTYLDDGNDPHMADYRLERLERQLDQLSAELLYVKQQQVKGQQQVVDLQTDLVAAELARQAAEEQLAHQQRNDHEMMITLFQKFMDNQRSPNELPAIIDVTKYSDSESEMHQHVDENVSEKLQQISKELQELSLAVQQHSSDQLQQREALELAWMSYKSEQSNRLQHVEDDCTALFKSLKDMALKWDQKLYEMTAQIQKVKKIVASQNISSLSSIGPPLVTETAEKVESLSSDLAQLQQSMQRYLDSHHRINGERIVTKRKTEKDLRSVRHAIKQLATVVFELAERMDSRIANIVGKTIEEEPSLEEEDEEAEEKYVEESETFQEVDMEHHHPQPILDLDDSAKCEEPRSGHNPEYTVEAPVEETDRNIVTGRLQLLESNGSLYEKELVADEEPSFLGEIHSFQDIASESIAFVKESKEPENEAIQNVLRVGEEEILDPNCYVDQETPVEATDAAVTDDGGPLEDTTGKQREPTISTDIQHNKAVEDVFDEY